MNLQSKAKFAKKPEFTMGKVLITESKITDSEGFDLSDNEKVKD